jgi:hypothetical protein
MTNLLQQAINCDDAGRAARIIRDALGRMARGDSPRRRNSLADIASRSGPRALMPMPNRQSK